MINLKLVANDDVRLGPCHQMATRHHRRIVLAPGPEHAMAVGSADVTILVVPASTRDSVGAGQVQEMRE
jgi:hypothetical protein